jgi:hypothetical protein
MKEHKTTEEQRERMLAYYYSHRQQILEQKRKERAKERQHKKEQREREKQDEQTKEYQRILETWNLYILERLQSPKKLPNWMKHFMTLQVIHNNNRINEIEKHEQSSSTRR